MPNHKAYEGNQLPMLRLLLKKDKIPEKRKRKEKRKTGVVKKVTEPGFVSGLLCSRGWEWMDHQHGWFGTSRSVAFAEPEAGAE